MVSLFRLRLVSFKLCTRFPAFFRVLPSGPRAILADRSLGRLLMVGGLAVALWFGAVGTYAHPAQAANQANTQAYEAGPIRKSRNPVSGENFHGGVEPSVFDTAGSAPTPEGKAEGFLESVRDTVKDVLPGTSADDSDISNRGQADVNTRQNPTLRRYGTDQQ